MSEPRHPASVADTGVVVVRPTGSWRQRRAPLTWLGHSLAGSTRISILVGLFAVALGSFGASLGQAFASTVTHSNDVQQWGTPTPTPYRSWPGAQGTPTPYGGYNDPWRQTPTPTPYGRNPNSQYPTSTPTPYGTNQYPNQNGYPNQNTYPSSGGGSSVQGGNEQYPTGGGSIPGAIVPNPSMAPNGSPQQTPAGAAADPCYGDEQITFSPEQPRVGNELLIAVTSSRPHPYGRLAGTEPAQFSRERPGQRGYVWEWLVQVSYPGQHEYTFYVDSTIPCQKIQIGVRQQLATATPTATRTPKPYRYN